MLERNNAYSSADDDKHKPADLIMFRYESVEMYGISRFAMPSNPLGASELYALR